MEYYWMNRIKWHKNPVFGIENPEYRIFVRKTKRYLERKNAIWSDFERCDAYVKITLEISEKSVLISIKNI